MTTPAHPQELRELEKGIQVMGEAQAHTGGVMTQSREAMADLKQRHSDTRHAAACRILRASVRRWYTGRLSHAFAQLRFYALAAEQEGALARERRVLASARAQAARALEAEALASVRGSEAAAKARHDAAAELEQSQARVGKEVEDQIAHVRDSHAAELRASRTEVARARHAAHVAQTQRSAVLLTLSVVAGSETRSRVHSAMRAWQASTAALRAREAGARADLAARARHAVLRTAPPSGPSELDSVRQRVERAEKERDEAHAALACVGEGKERGDKGEEEEENEVRSLQERLKRLAELHARTLRRAAAMEKELEAARAGDSIVADQHLRAELRAELQSSARAWLQAAGADAGAGQAPAVTSGPAGRGAVTASASLLDETCDAAMSAPSSAAPFSPGNWGAASDHGALAVASQAEQGASAAAEERPRSHAHESEGRDAPRPAWAGEGASSASALESGDGRPEEGVTMREGDKGEGPSQWRERALTAEAESHRLRTELQARGVQLDLAAANRDEAAAEAKRAIESLRAQVAKLREQRSLLKAALLDQRGTGKVAKRSAPPTE